MISYSKVLKIKNYKKENKDPIIANLNLNLVSKNLKK